MWIVVIKLSCWVPSLEILIDRPRSHITATFGFQLMRSSNENKHHQFTIVYKGITILFNFLICLWKFKQ
jgi:hypothetical protein